MTKKKSKAKPKFKVGDIVKPIGVMNTTPYIVSYIYPHGTVAISYDVECEYCAGRGTTARGHDYPPEMLELADLPKRSSGK